MGVYDFEEAYRENRLDEAFDYELKRSFKFILIRIK